MQRRAQIVEEAEDLKGKIAEKDLQLAAASRPTEQDTPAAGAAVSAPPEAASESPTPRIPDPDPEDPFAEMGERSPYVSRIARSGAQVRVPRAEKLVQKKAGEGDKEAEYEAFLESF
eukprot:COSAG04_NODE_1428_length_6799_cov_5.203134_2_plen_117_part_00